MPMLFLNNVEVTFHPFITVLKGVSLGVEEGTITALLGPNGAGKTTTLKAISGLIRLERGRVTRGSIVFMGEKIENMDPERIARKGVIYVPEGRRVFAELTVEENLNAVAMYWDADPREAYDYFPRLRARRKTRAGYLSGGEQQMLAIAMALLAKPKLLLLDEPSLGLSPKAVNDVYDEIRKLRDEGITMLLVEQNARKAFEVADYAYIMERGRIVAEGHPEELRMDRDIAEFYLGLKSSGGYREARWYRRKKRWV